MNLLAATEDMNESFISSVQDTPFTCANINLPYLPKRAIVHILKPFTSSKIPKLFARPIKQGAQSSRDYGLIIPNLPRELRNIRTTPDQDARTTYATPSSSARRPHRVTSDPHAVHVTLCSSPHAARATPCSDARDAHLTPHDGPCRSSLPARINLDGGVRQIFAALPAYR